MTTPTIPNGETQFFPIIYEGNGGAQRVGKFVPFTDNGTIDNSCIFNRADDATMTRTPSSAGTRTKFTVSVWVKLGSNFGTRRFIFYAAASGNNFSGIEISANNSFRMYASDGSGSIDLDLESSRTLEDTSKWYHLLAVFDSTQSTASDRAKMYIDGDQITNFSTSTFNLVQDFQFQGTNNVLNVVGGWNSSLGGSPATYAFDGYMAEMNLVDGSALTPDTFGVTDTSTGRWIPKALTGITYGTNGFRLKFQDSSALGDDTSGNSQDFSVNNIVAGDQTTDSPTQNHATLNANPTASGGTLSEGNLKLVTNNTGYNVKYATLKPKTGKYYAEFTIGSGGAAMIGVQDANVLNTATSSYFPYGYGYGWYEGNGNVYDENVAVVLSGTSYTSGDVIAMALDLDNQTLKWYKNNSLAYTVGLNGTDIVMAVGDYANADDATITCNFGQKSFTYTPPTGFVALQQDNLPETAKGVSGLVWIKSRDTASAHMLFDSTRGPQLRLKSDSTSAEALSQGTVTKFLKGGYAVGNQTAVNKSGDSTVAWNWVANGGTTASNGDGSISSTVQANTTAGFSIVEWTGDGGQSTVGHGLSGTPKVVIQKRLSSTSDWWFYTTALDGSYDYGKLNVNGSFAAQSAGSAPTSTTFTSHGWGSSDNLVAYVFHEVEGFSKFGSYTGNGVADGPFVYTGFKPAWLLVKSNNAANWYLCDAARSTMNPVTTFVHPDRTDADYTNFGRGFDFLSNGFKVRQESGYGANYSGVVTFYMAFAEHPFVGDGTSPVTAR